MRRVDELAAADVDADVAEAVEEDEVAGLEIAARHRHAHVPLGARVVRKRDADLRVDVRHEAGAVEARRALTAPHVLRAEVAHGDPDDAAVLRRRSDRRAAGRRRDADRVSCSASACCCWIVW